MLVVFFIGIGIAAVATGFAQSPLQVGIGLFAIGMFAAIYHPVGLAMVTQKWKNTGMRLAVNGVWGNLGVASAALITGYLIDHGGWRMAFIAPGCISIATGVAYALARHADIAAERATKASAGGATPPINQSALFMRVSLIVFLTTAVSSIIFQATTFALPKIFDERLQGLSGEAAAWLRDHGWPAARTSPRWSACSRSRCSRSPRWRNSLSAVCSTASARAQCSWAPRQSSSCSSP